MDCIFKDLFEKVINICCQILTKISEFFRIQIFVYCIKTLRKLKCGDVKKFDPDRGLKRFVSPTLLVSTIL